MSDFNNDPSSAVLSKIEDIIERNGYAVLTVAGISPLETYSYTIGLVERGWPELVIMALGQQHSAMIINAVVRKLDSDNRIPASGMTITEALNVPIRALPVPTPWAKTSLLFANDRAEMPEGVPAIQLLFPDPAGCFPGDENYDFKAFPQKVLSTH